MAIAWPSRTKHVRPTAVDFANTEVLTIREHQIVEVEVYFGWSLPHKAPQGGFVDPPPQQS